MSKRYDGLKNFYQMRMREHREEIDELKGQITALSNMVWQLKMDIEERKKNE